MNVNIDNPILVYSILGLAVSAIGGIGFLLIRTTLRKEARSKLEKRIETVKHGYILHEDSGQDRESIFLEGSPSVSPGTHKKSVFVRSLSAWLGSKPSRNTLILLIVFPVVAVPVFVVIFVLFNVWLALVAGVSIAAISLVILWVHKFVRNMFLGKCEAQLPEVLDFIVRALRAGHAFPTAIYLVGEEVPPPLGPEFRRIFKTQELGIQLSTELIELTKMIPILDMKYFVTAYLVNREIGGNLTEVLDSSARIIRERFKLKRHVAALTAEGRMSAWVLGGLPFITAFGIFAMRPDYFIFMVSESTGRILILISFLMWLVGIIVIRKLVNVEC